MFGINSCKEHNENKLKTIKSILLNSSKNKPIFKYLKNHSI